MSSRNRNRQICIALVVFLASCLFACAKGFSINQWEVNQRVNDFYFTAYHDERRKEFIPVLQFVATVALFFGILKAPREHESVFLLFWLVCTLIFWLVLLFCGCDLVIYNRVSIRRDDTITLFVVVAISIGECWVTFLFNHNLISFYLSHFSYGSLLGVSHVQYVCGADTN